MGTDPENKSKMAKVTAATLIGVDARTVRVEVDLQDRLPFMQTVGLPSRSVMESEDRVRSALGATGVKFPKKRVVVNLAPADLPKSGTAFDLPIALGLLRAMELVESERCDRYLLLGELSLDAILRPVPGVLAAAMAAREAGFEGIVVPRANGHEAALVDELDVAAVRTLAEAVDFLDGKIDAPPLPSPLAYGLHNRDRPRPDLSEVRGLEHARLALEVAAAGGHNLMLTGPPGTGKSVSWGTSPTFVYAAVDRDGSKARGTGVCGGFRSLRAELQEVVATLHIRRPHVLLRVELALVVFDLPHPRFLHHVVGVVQDPDESVPEVVARLAQLRDLGARLPAWTASFDLIPDTLMEEVQTFRDGGALAAVELILIVRHPDEFRSVQFRDGGRDRWGYPVATLPLQRDLHELLAKCRGRQRPDAHRASLFGGSIAEPNDELKLEAQDANAR